MAEVLAPHAALRSSTSTSNFFDAPSSFAASKKHSYSLSDLRSHGSLSSSQSSSYLSTPSSSRLSLETKFDDSSDSDDEDGIAFPAYAAGKSRYFEEPPPPSSPVDTSRPSPSPVDGTFASSPAPTPDTLLVSEDDTAVRVEPSRHVDYLSHEWQEEDIWSSWRHIVTQRKVYGERSRLENASWRTWAKSQFKLRTVSPETLNWLKDVDVTWLYGPLQPAANRSLHYHQSEPISRLSKTNSFLHKKPILKKRSMSEVMLQRSLSASSLIKQAAAAVQAQQQNGYIPERRRHRPMIGRAQSDFVSSSIPSQTTSRDPIDYLSSHTTSGLQTPEHAERKHIRFDDKVEQCIAVDVKDGDFDEDEEPPRWSIGDDDDESSDDGVIMMKRSRKKRQLSRTNSRSSISGESKSIIAKLPSTTLKYRTDSPDVTEQQPTHSLGFWRSSRLSPSPSQETLRPSNPSTNFLLADMAEEDEDDDGASFNPSNAYELSREGTPTPTDRESSRPRREPGEASDTGGLRRTASGMFMPLEDDNENPPPPGLIGRVVDTVNTARDIAHVIWNVGWRN